MRFQELARWIIPAMWGYLTYSELFITNGEHSLVMGNIEFVSMIAATLWAAWKIPDYVFIAAVATAVLSTASFCLAWDKPTPLWCMDFVVSIYGFWLARYEYERVTTMEEE